MNIGRKAGIATYKTTTFGSVTAQTMLSAAFGGLIRTLADKVHTPLSAVDSMVIVCITYEKIEIDAYRLEISSTSLSSIDEEEHLV